MIGVMTPHILLVNSPEGNVEAIRFPSADTARDWEDAHPNIEAVGCVRIATKWEALSW